MNYHSLLALLPTVEPGSFAERLQSAFWSAFSGPIKLILGFLVVFLGVPMVVAFIKKISS